MWLRSLDNLKKLENFTFLDKHSVFYGSCHNKFLPLCLLSFGAREKIGNLKTIYCHISIPSLLKSSVYLPYKLKYITLFLSAGISERKKFNDLTFPLG